MLEKEKNELNLLIGNGIEFEVDDVEIVCRYSLFGLIRHRSIEKIKRKFTIEETCLGTLDRLSSEWIEFAADDILFQSNIDLKQAKQLSGEHCLRCAKIIAIAALGRDYFVPKITRSCVIQHVKNEEQLAQLTDLFYRNIKPSQLYQLVISLNAICNLGDFVNSIRLMVVERTTMPNRIEENTAV